MIRLKSLLLEITKKHVIRKLNEDSRVWKAWWMDDKGKLYEVYGNNPQNGHWNSAVNFLQGMGIDRWKYESPVQELFKKGWVRLTFNYYHDRVMNFDNEAMEIRPWLMKRIKDLAIEVGATSLHNDNTDRAVELNEDVLEEEMSYNDLLKLTDKGRKARAKDVKPRSIPVTMEDGKESWNFRYKSDPSVTDKPFQGSIQFFKEIKRSDSENVADLPCKVDCGCPDFMYRWAWNDTAQDASQVGPKSLSKCINRRPKPAYDYGEGLCKHLTALAGYLRTKIQATQKSNLFEAMSDVAKTHPNFTVEYYD